MTKTPTLRIPHTLALLFFLMIAALVATWLVPQGFFAEDAETGRVAPGSYEVVAERKVLSPLSLFTAIPRAFVDAGPIIFFLFIIGGVLAIIRATGTIDALLGRLLERFSDRPGMLILAVVFVFALASSAVGSSGEYIPFVLILVALCRAMRLDAMTTVGIVVTGYGVGYGVAAFNQYTVVVAQEIAGLPTYSGWSLRLALLVPFVLIAVHHVWRYADGVRRDPAASLVGDGPPAGAEPPAHYPPVEAGHAASGTDRRRHGARVVLLPARERTNLEQLRRPWFTDRLDLRGPAVAVRHKRPLQRVQPDPDRHAHLLHHLLRLAVHRYRRPSPDERLPRGWSGQPGAWNTERRGCGPWGRGLVQLCRQRPLRRRRPGPPSRGQDTW
jgi:hypothetical protein